MEPFPGSFHEPIVSGISDLTPRATGRHPEPRSPDARLGLPAPKKAQRISSLRPAILSTAAILLGGPLSIVAIRTLFTAPLHGTLLFVPAALLLVAGGALKLGLKSVAFDGNRYRITGLFLTEEIAPGDVCLVVEARGAFWNTIRLHFNRPTRFGYDVAFVPAGSFKNAAVLVARLRSLPHK